jgi:ATPase subunit of ABC transporter with duplicated ATPase domains
MPTILANNLSFQLDTGEWLFKDITFSLSSRLTGLVGRNGAGKSLLLSLLVGQTQPTSGSVSKQGSIGFYSQLPSTLLDSATTIADFLGLTEKLDALHAIEQGSCELQHFSTSALQYRWRGLGFTSEHEATFSHIENNQWVNHAVPYIEWWATRPFTASSVIRIKPRHTDSRRTYKPFG